MVDFSRSIIDIIPQRVSTRTFKPLTMGRETLAKLDAVLSMDHETPFGERSRFELVALEGTAPGERRKLGTYGFIVGARYFIVGVAGKTPRANENLGYSLERVILHATDLGLGTCWLGGTFKRSAFARRGSLPEHEQIPAITPVGVPSKSLRLVELAFRFALRASKRKPWSVLFFEGNIKKPLDAGCAGEYRVPLEMVRLGPSAKNGQPWRILKEIDSNTFHFYIARESVTGWSRNDIGIAVCHFDLTCRELHLEGKWDLGLTPRMDTPGWTHVISWIGL
ncbi:MAG: nitroreductase family protein [Promethearchaeota archaeon]